MSDFAPIPADVMAALREASTATITTQLFNRGLRNCYLSGLRPMNPGACRFVGEAMTLRNIPAREDLDVVDVYKDPNHPQRKAIELAGPGKVLVMDCRGDQRAASAGNILVTRLRMRGCEGLVTDGPLRDSPDIAQQAFPVFATGASATMSLRVHHAVDIDVPIGCAGVPVFPGDIIVGDEEGVVVIPRHLAAEIAEPAARQEDLERFVLEKIEAGAALPGTYPPSAAVLAEYEAWTRRGKR